MTAASSGRITALLIGPHPRIGQPDDRAGASLLAVLMLVQLGVILAVVSLLEVVWRGRFGSSTVSRSEFWPLAAGAASILVAYVILRAGRYRAAAVLYVITTAAVGVLTPFASSNNAEIGLIAASIVPVFLTAIAFPERWIITVLIAVVAATAAQLATHDLPPATLQTGIALTAIVLITGLLAVLLRRHERLCEQRHVAGARESEAAYRGLFESITDGVLIVENGGRILEANQTACEQFGYARDELLGSSVYDLTTLSTDEGARLCVAALTCPNLKFEITCRRKDGVLLPIEVAVSPIEFRGRRALVSSARDLSERRRAEEERVRLEAKLRESSKLESMGMLAGGVAHDFNNLLTAILGNVSLAEDPCLPPHVSESLREIRRAADSAAALTRQLLTFSRRQVIEPRLIDLNKHLISLRKMLVRLIGEDIELSTLLDAGLYPVKVDPGLIEQVVVNLAVNARDAMPEGGRLSIATMNVNGDESLRERHPSLGQGDYVMLIVSDTGVGMTPEIKARIFEPFFTTKGQGRGTGLGLATTYGAVHQSGGAIDVDTEPGKGTTFRVLLPRAHGELSGGDVALPPAPPRLGTESILLVEDDAAIRRLAEMSLTSAGYRVVSAESGERALDLVADRLQEMRALVTDVVLPGINGRRLADTLRQRHAALKVLYTSGYTDNVIGHRGVLDEGMAFLPKPYAPRDLLARVRQVIDSP